MVKVEFSGAEFGDWLVNWRLWGVITIRLKIVESASPGPGPVFEFDLPWVNKKIIFRCLLEVRLFVAHAFLKWNFLFY